MSDLIATNEAHLIDKTSKSQVGQLKVPMGIDLIKNNQNKLKPKIDGTTKERIKRGKDAITEQIF